MDQEAFLVKVAENGRLSIPARQRKLLGLEEGGLVVARLEGGELRIRPIRDVIAGLQARVARYACSGEGSDWLLKERRREVAREGLLAEGISASEHTRRGRDRCASEEGTRSRSGR